MKILVINAGSSSMKFTLFEMEKQAVLAKGVFERLGSSNPNLVYKRPDGFKFEAVIPVKDHAEAVSRICEKLTDPEIGVIKSLGEVAAVGHRVLHGGEKFSGSVIVNDKVIEAIEECCGDLGGEAYEDCVAEYKEAGACTLSSTVYGVPSVPPDEEE